MKSKWLFVLCLSGLFASEAFSQAQAFRDFIIAANSPTNPKTSPNMFTQLGGKDRFELVDWGKGWAISRGDELIRDGYSFNFDYEHNDLYVLKDDEGLTVVVEESSVKTFVLFNGLDSVRFVKSIFLDPKNKTFYQVVGGDPMLKTVLLKHRVAKMVPVNKNDYARNFNGDYTPDYQNSATYFVVDEDKGVHSFKQLGKKDLLALYPEYQDLIETYLPGNKKPDEPKLGMLFNELSRVQ